MTIHLISFASILHKQASLRNSHEAILSELEKYYTVKLIDYQDMDKLGSDDFKIIFIATAPPFYWPMACRTHLLRHWKYLHGSVEGE